MLTEKEKMQVREVVDKVVEARLMEFAEIQLSMISDMLVSMTDKYVESLMQLARMMRAPEEAARKEAERMSQLMSEHLRK
ncbi:MAG TPA: hypothetical protein VNW90_19285 [Acetobacteraceae bacterium]|jgi:hypothetical protein|nr:hypothetical protein [Acetobacteraceae bacterium]